MVCDGSPERSRSGLSMLSEWIVANPELARLVFGFRTKHGHTVNLPGAGAAGRRGFR